MDRMKPKGSTRVGRQRHDSNQVVCRGLLRETPKMKFLRRPRIFLKGTFSILVLQKNQTFSTLSPTLMRVATLIVFALLAVAARAQFGPATRQLFMMNANYTNFNHGSYGTVPRVVHDAQNSYSLQCEQNPDAWFRFPDTGLKPILNQARKHMGTYLGITQQSYLNGLVFVDNASGAVNAVLRSLLIGATEEDVVIYFQTVYGMVC
jgi:hypothetical protein